MSVRRRRERGVVLPVVLFFALLLTSGIATFTRRATIDSMIARNRESASRTEILSLGAVVPLSDLLRAVEKAGTDFQETEESGGGRCVPILPRFRELFLCDYSTRPQPFVPILHIL